MHAGSTASMLPLLVKYEAECLTYLNVMKELGREGSQRDEETYRTM